MAPSAPGRSPSWAPDLTTAPEDETPPPLPSSNEDPLLLRVLSSTIVSQKSKALQARWNRLRQSHPIVARVLLAALTHALGAALGSYYQRRRSITGSSNQSSTTTKSGGRQRRASSSRSSTPQQGGIIDWWEVLAFAAYGGCIAGPASHHWDNYMERHGPETTPTQRFLLDQLAVQPPRLWLTLAAVQVLRTALPAVPRALRDAAIDHASQVTAASWKFWPLAVYLLRRRYFQNQSDSSDSDDNDQKMKQNRRRYKLGLNVCAVVWTAYLAQRRAAAAVAVRP